MVSSTTPQTSLSQLRDIHLPDPVSIWPLAPGWYILAALILGIISLVSYIAYRYWKKQRAKRAALQMLILIEKEYQQQNDAQAAMAELSILLRRVALAYFPRLEIAGLHNSEWLEFLNKTGKTNAFTIKAANLFTKSPYKKSDNKDISIVFPICRQWIKKAAKHAHI